MIQHSQNEIQNEEIDFSSLGLDSNITEKLKPLGIEKPTAVQKEVIPLILQKKDVAFQSETGTGKTLAYLLPASQMNARIIVISPTAELGAQIKRHAKEKLGLSSVLAAGGSPIQRQAESLKEKPAVVCATAARIVELSRLKKVKVRDFSILVLDELDRLLSPELRDSTEEAIKTFSHAQLISCSATIPKKSLELLSRFSQKKIELIRLPQENVLQKRIFHIAIFSQTRDKIDTLRRFLSAVKVEKALIFTAKSADVHLIAEKLSRKNIICASLSAKSGKVERKSTIDRFRSGKIRFLVTSDLTSRGMDIDGITHVIQMDTPEDADFFVHRAGRTARAGKTGTNVVIGNAKDMIRLSAIEKKLKIAIHPREIRGGKLIKIEDGNETINV